MKHLRYFAAAAVFIGGCGVLPALAQAPTARYTLDLSWKDVAFTNSMALAEMAIVEVRNIGNATPEGLIYYLSDREGTAMALGTNIVAGTVSNSSVGVLNLQTSELRAFFAGLNPYAERTFSFSVWDSANDILLGSGPVAVRNNPLADQLLTGWTNVPEVVESELLAAIAGLVAMVDAGDTIARADISSLQEALYNLEIGGVNFGTNSTSAFRGDWGASVSNLAAQAAGWGDHAADIATLTTGKLDAVDARMAQWLVWSDINTNYHALSGDRSIKLTNESFSAIMNEILQGENSSGTVIDLANTRDGTGYSSFFYIDAPIYIGKSEGGWSCTHIRGDGGPAVSLAPGYTGRMFVAGDDTYRQMGQTRICGFNFHAGDDQLSANTNAAIYLGDCSDVEISSIYFSGFAGPAISAGRDLSAIQLNNLSIHGNWIYSQRGQLPMIDIAMPDDEKMLLGANIQNNYFFNKSNAVVAVQGGGASHVAVHDNIFNRFYVGGGVGQTGVVFKAGTGHSVQGNAFMRYLRNSVPVAFLPASSNSFASTVAANAYGTSDTTNAVLIGENAHGVEVWGNSMPSAAVNQVGDNTGGFVLNLGSVLTIETDSAALEAIGDLPTNDWDTAYGWGDHAEAGYLTDFTETDPEFAAWLAGDPLDGLLPSDGPDGAWEFIEDYVAIHIPLSLSALDVRGGRVLLESTLRAASFVADGGSSLAEDAFASLPIALTNTLMTRTNLSGHTVMEIVTTNSYGLSSGMVMIYDGDEAEPFARFTPACDGVTTQRIDYAWLPGGNRIRFFLSPLPVLDPAGPPEIVSVRFFNMADTNQVGRRLDTANSVYEGDDAVYPRQWLNLRSGESLAAAALASANQETRYRTGPTDLQGNIMHYNPRYYIATSSNLWTLYYSGEAVYEVDGTGAKVTPRIVAYYVEGGETTTMTVWSYSGGATNLIPEVSTNLQTWVRLETNAIVSAEMVDDFTAQVVFTNAAASAMFVRLVDVSGGEGLPTHRFRGEMIGDGSRLTGITASATNTGSILEFDSLPIVTAILDPEYFNFDGTNLTILLSPPAGTTGDLAATNTPTAGQMLYASDNSKTNLYFGDAPSGSGIHPRMTAVTNGSGAAYIWPASSAWWRVYAANTITGIVPVVDGAGITGADLLLLGIEIFREEGVDFSWGGGDAPLAGVTNEVPANEISLHGLWRPSGGTNWVGF